MDLDDILLNIGEFGRYQKLLVWLICLPACIPCGFCAFNQLFFTNVPDHWCQIPEGMRDFLNLTTEEIKILTIPKVNGTYLRCFRYVIDYTKFNIENGLNLSTDLQYEKCLDGWVYNTSLIPSSVVIDYDLVCEKEIYPTLGLVFLNLGGPFGVYFFGWCNDRIGRKKTFFVCLSTLIGGSVLSAVASNVWYWYGSRFVVGTTIPAIYQIPFIICLELVGPHYRSFVTVQTCLFYTFGLMLLAGVAYFIRDWVYLNLVTSVPFCLYFLFWFFLPESPRWLLAKGRDQEALTILEEIARVNKKPFPENVKEELKNNIRHRKNSKPEELVKSKDLGLMDLFRTPNMRLKTVLITINWFINNMVYVGLSYYGPALGDNEYVSFFLSSAVEIPSYIICWILIDRWGRRWPLCISMVISGVSCIATVSIPPENEVATLWLFLLAKSAISASFLIIYPFAGELYPTSVRGVGIGFSAYIAGLGLIIIPFVTYLGSEILVLPLIILGGISVFGGLLSLRLPETLHQRLPQTLDEGEEFGKNFGLKDFLTCVPKRSEMDLELEETMFLDLNPLTDASVEESKPIKPLERRKSSLKRLVRQQSVMDTQRAADGTMNLTYWF